MWTKEQFEAWRASAATKDFLAFLAERREALKEQWAEGTPLTPADQMVAAVYGDIITLAYEDVENFYQAEEKHD
jgi:hypothetical protein